MVKLKLEFTYSSIKLFASNESCQFDVKFKQVDTMISTEACCFSTFNVTSN